ncbi:MAG: hypothetical protein ACR2N4_10150 [Jatrophihabitans sp.]
MRKSLLVSTICASLIVPAIASAPADAIGHRPATTCTAPDMIGSAYGTAQVPYTNMDVTPDGALKYRMPTGTLFQFCSNTATKVSTNTWVYGSTASGSTGITGWVNEGRLVNIRPIN